MEDEEIIALLFDRNERGLDELSKKYGGRLRQLAERILSDPDAAECINDTYLAVWVYLCSKFIRIKGCH